MIARTISSLRQDWVFYTFVIAMLAGLGVAEDLGLLSISGSVTLVVDAIIFFFVQRSVLYGVSMSAKGTGDMRSSPSFGYMLKFLVVVFCAAGPTLAIGFFLYIDGSFPLGELEIIAIAVLASFILVPLGYTLLGTWLPASIFGQETGFGAAIARGLSAFGRNFVRYFAVWFIQLLCAAAIFVVYVKIVPVNLEPAFSGEVAIDVAVNLATAALRVLVNALLAVLMVLHYQKSIAANEAHSLANA